MALDPQASPVLELLFHQARGALRLQTERVSAEVQELAAGGVAWVVEFRGQGRERVGGVELPAVPSDAGRGGQEGACMSVPHTVQVRSFALP